MSHIFHSSILRSYDIRGIHGQTLTDKDAYFIGKSFATTLDTNKRSKVVVGYDGRFSSPSLKNNLIKGLIGSGIDVVEIGLCPTPMLYFGVYHLDADAGIMVTGSHNPPDHNGLKISLKNYPFYGDDIKNLGEIAKKGSFIEGNGKLEKSHILNDYINRLVKDSVIDSDKPNISGKKLKIAWDAGNGSAGEVMEKLTKHLDSENILLFEDIDGNFPNHHPDPTVEENLEDLKKTVLDNKCDLGIAFDGDGDRLGVVDDKGDIIWGDQLMVFFAKEVLEKNPGATIIADVKASKILFDQIKSFGGNPLMWKTGHSLIKAKMKEEKSILAGEMSGHIFFADKYYGFDDGLYAAIRIINIVANSNKSLSSLRKSLPNTFSTPEMRIACDEDKKNTIIDNVKQDLRRSNIDFNDIDGIRATTEDGWWLLRASNTQAALVARCEANSPESLKVLKDSLDLKIKKELS